jgi:putative transcriptional regulator
MGEDDDYTRVLVELTNVLGEPIQRTVGPVSNLRPHIPDRIDVAAIRQLTGLSQPAFASRIGVTVSTVRKWEQGRHSPLGPARVLLALVERNPKIIEEILGRTGQTSTSRLHTAAPARTGTGP